MDCVTIVPFDFRHVTEFYGLHAISHLTCDFPRLLHATDVEYKPMKQFFGDERPNNYWWFVKGTEGWTGVVMVVLMAIAFILAQPWFRRNRLKLPKPLKNLTSCTLLLSFCSHEHSSRSSQVSTTQYKIARVSSL